MSKAKKFRVCVAGDTVDGRVIESQMLFDAVDTFNPQTYGVRVNVEHIRGLSGDRPFGSLGDVTALELAQDEIDIGGKKEKRTALYATIIPNERAIELNKNDQKVYTSCEFVQNFAGSGKWGMVGLAVTDSPASIGTQRLEFSKAVGSAISKPLETELIFDQSPTSEAQTEALSAFKAMKDFFSGLTGKPQPELKPEPKPEPIPAPMDLAAQLLTGITTVSEAVSALNTSTNEALSALKVELAALKSDLETVKSAPAGNFNRAPISGGGDTKNLSSF